MTHAPAFPPATARGYLRHVVSLGADLLRGSRHVRGVEQKNVDLTSQAITHAEGEVAAYHFEGLNLPERKHIEVAREPRRR